MGFWRFSLIAFALLILFLPEFQDTVKKAGLWLKYSALLQTCWSGLRKGKWLLLAVIVALGVILPNTTGDARTWVRQLGHDAIMLVLFLFFIECAVLIAASLVTFYRYRFAKAPALDFCPAIWSGLLVAAIMVFSGISPYLGLKTLNAFAMYSNLRTEGGYSNHFVVPAGWQVFSYQKDLVDVVETNILSLQEVVDKDLLLPYQQLRAEITREKKHGTEGIRVVFRRNGETFSTAHAEDDPQLGQPVNAILYRFLTFRPVEKEGARACTN
jgi:hypothetical protein